MRTLQQNTNVGELFKGLVRLMMKAENREGGAPAATGGGGPIEANAEEPKTSGDKSKGGCECVLQ